MTLKSVAALIAVALICRVPVHAQSAAELLQKGIYAQETAGDLDNAIRIFRQVADPASGNKNIAAQAQYQLVLCMLQRGDRATASKEVETLARNFSDQPEIIGKARKLLPGASAILSAPWGERESFQLNIKRAGVPTGEYLYYSVDPALETGEKPIPNQQWLRWQLKTTRSKRSVLTMVDRTTGQTNGRPDLQSNDFVGDPAVESLAGPAIDIQQSVFVMRRLPLAVGYKTTLPALPLSLSHLAPKDVELTVTGVEPVEVTAGKFRCYKVSIASLGQTFWFGVEGSRPLVKFTSGDVEAEMVKMWGTEDFIPSELEFFRPAGWVFERVRMLYGSETSALIRDSNDPRRRSIDVSANKIYTAPADIDQELRSSAASARGTCAPETIQTRVIGGQKAISCFTNLEGIAPNGSYYKVWIRSTTASIEITAGEGNLPILRWQIDQVLATAKRIP